MPDTFKKLAQVQPTATAATIYTAPAATSAIVKIIRVVNTDQSASHNFRLYQGGTALTNAISNLIALGPNEEHVDDVGTVVGAGDTIAAVADAPSVVTITLLGDEIT